MNNERGLCNNFLLFDIKKSTVVQERKSSEYKYTLPVFLSCLPSQKHNYFPTRFVYWKGMRLKMNDIEALDVASKIFFNIFERENPYSLEQILEKFAFDVKLPVEVKDSLTGEITWSEMPTSKGFITQNNMEKYDEKHGWMLKKRPVQSLEDVINVWNKINYTTTERIYDSMNVSKSDTIYESSNIYRSCDCRKGKNIIFCDGTRKL